MKTKTKPVSRQKKRTINVPKKKSLSPPKTGQSKLLTALYWQSALDAVTDAVCFLDTDQRILHCNRAMTEMFGLTQKEIIGKHCWEIVHDTTKPISKCPTTRAKKSLVRENGEIRKGDRWFNITADPILDKKGKLKGVVHTLQDITERKRTIQALQESEIKYRQLVENVSEVIFSVDMQGVITYISPAMEHLTGYSTKEVIGTNITNHILPEDLSKVLASINRILDSGQEESVEYRVKIKNGEIRYVLSSSKIILKNKQPTGLTGVITDITERKQTEEALKDAELKFRTIFEFASDGILLVETVSKNFISANDRICAMLGYTKKEFLKLNVSDIHPKKYLPYVIDQFEKLACNEITISHDIPVLKKDKTVFFADINSSSVTLSGKEYLMGIFRDVTERKQAEKVLKERDIVYRKLSANVPGMIYQFMRKPDGNYCAPFTTDAIKDIFGCSSGDVVNDFSPIAKVIYPDDFERLIDSIEESARKMSHWKCEFRVQIPGKPLRWLLGNSTPEKQLADGSIIWHGFCTDITERKLTEAALQERDAAFRKLSAHVPGAIYQFVRKPDGTYHLPFSSDTIKKIFGYSPQELANDFSLVTNAILPEDMDGFISTIEYSAQHMTDWKYEYRIQLPGEAVRWMLGQSTPEKLPDGSIIWHGFNADITEQKETQENLKISQENYKRLFDEHSAVKLLIDPETGNIMDANYAAVAFYGWTRDEIKQMKIWQINTLSEQEVKHEMNNALKKKKLHFEFRHRLADGSIRNVEVYSSKIKINGRDVLHSIIHDSTDRKQIEEALVKSELKFKRLFENSPVGVFMLKDRIIIDVNPALCNITGYSPEEIVGNSVRIIYANDEEFERAGSSVYEQVFKNGIGSIEAQLIRKNGDIFYGLLFLTQIDPRDSSFGYEGIMVDIDERKRADEKLKLEQQRFKSLTESSSDIIFVLNTEGIITYVNPAIEKGLGYKPEERIGKYGLEFVHPDDLQSVNSKFNILVNSTKYSILHTEDRMRHKDGSWRIFEATGNNLIKDNVVEAIIIRLHDITERKEKDQELFETKERYRILFEDSPDPYLILGNGKILDCNRSAEKMFLCSREKLIGTSPDQFSPEFQPNGRPSNEAAKEIIEKTLQKGLCTFEWTHTRMDGSDFPVEVSASTMVMDGRIVLLGVFRDITERKHAENALRVSEEKYRGIFDESIAAIYIFDSKKNFIDSNQAGLDLLGYSREELLHISIPDVDADPVVVRPAHQELFDGGRLINFEHKLRRKDGSIVNVINNSRPLTDSQGNTIGMLSTLIDITERKRAEAEIAVLSNALKLALDPILILDLEGKIINVNEAAKKLFETEDLGVSALDYVAPEDKEKVTVTMQALLMGSSVNIAEFTVITKSGRRVFIEATGNLIVDENGKATGLVVVERDITERKRMEESLLQEQQFSKSVLDNLPEIFYLFTYPENRLKLGNKQVEMLLGFNTEETIGRHVTEWIVPEYRDAVLKAIDEVMEKGRNSIEAPLLTKDGHQIPFFLTGAKFVVDDQSYFMGIGMELTERKKAEEALLDSETKLKAVIQGSPVPQFVIDKNHKILYWNKALEEISGIKSADVLGTNKHWHAFYTHERPCLADLLVDEKINLIPELYKGKYNESNYVDGAYEAEDFFPVIGKWLFFGAALIRDAHGNIIGALETLEDTTERKQAEKDLEKYREHLEELVRERTIHLEASNKELEAFSYSASHDLRAPLRSIEGFSQALLEDYEDKLNTHGKDYLTRIKMATRRMADLIEDMLQLSRITRMEMNIEKVNLTAVANSVISDLQKSQPQRNVKVKIAEGMDDHADSRLSRIIMDNLLRNAWKFTEKQANATIEFGLWKKEDEIKVYFVRDNGAGFDMAYADKLFAPFQRLHADDEFPGTGIGLATVRRILNRHGGRIWAEGETGKGATFYFSFSEK